MRIKYLLFPVLFSCFFAIGVFAQSNQEKIDEVISAYRFYKDISGISISVPTVVEVPFENDFIERYDFAVFNNNTNVFEPYYFRRQTHLNTSIFYAGTQPYVDNANVMVDGKSTTYSSFSLDENQEGSIEITLNSSSPVTSSALTVLLDQYVALPKTVEIRALTEGRESVVFANSKMNAGTVRFPKTTASTWKIIFTYGQPLRISELRLSQENVDRLTSQAVRFLAQPSQVYRIYFDPDRRVVPPVAESGQLSSVPERDIVFIPATASRNNQNYKISDVDKDGIADIYDNCVNSENPDQIDVNNNGRGDDCDDFDLDGIVNTKDNCPNQPNRNQRDEDADGIGDVCDQEESRITERYTWVPWAGMGFAAVVIISLFVLTVRMPQKKEEIQETAQTPEDRAEQKKE